MSHSKKLKKQLLLPDDAVAIMTLDSIHSQMNFNKREKKEKKTPKNKTKINVRMLPKKESKRELREIKPQTFDFNALGERSSKKKGRQDKAKNLLHQSPYLRQKKKEVAFMRRDSGTEIDEKATARIDSQEGPRDYFSLAKKSSLMIDRGGQTNVRELGITGITGSDFNKTQQ